MAKDNQPNNNPASNLPKRASDFKYELQHLLSNEVLGYVGLCTNLLRKINRDEPDNNIKTHCLIAFVDEYPRFCQAFHPSENTVEYTWQHTEPEFKALAELTIEAFTLCNDLALSLQSIPNKKKLTAHLLYLAMFFIGQAILFTYERSIWVPKEVWKALHQLYMRAEQRGFLITKHENPMGKQADNSIGQLYSQICTTATADPYRLAKGEIWVIYDYCYYCAEHIEILPPIRALLQAKNWVIDLSGTSRPRSDQITDNQQKKAPTNSNTGNQFVRHFSLNKVQSLLEHHIFLLDQGKRLTERSITLNYKPTVILSALKKLLFSWQKGARDLERAETSEVVQLIWGLTNVHNKLKEQQGLSSNSNHHLGGAKVIDAYLQNHSKHGLGFHVDPSLKNELITGELVAITRKKNTFVSIGNIQWSALDENGRLHSGIQVIEGHPEPISLLKIEDNHRFERKGILIQEYDEPKLSNNSLPILTIITTSNLFQIGETAEFEIPGTDEQHTIIIKQTKRDTGVVCFHQCEIQLPPMEPLDLIEDPFSSL